MKNMIRTAVLAVALIFATAPVHAQDITPFVGIGLGGFNLDESEPGFSISDTVFGGYLQAGFDYGDYLGAELRIGTTGDASMTAFGVAIDYGPTYFLSYLAKVQYPVTSELRVYGLIGGTTSKVEATGTVAGISASTSQTETGVSFGGGVDYAVMPNVRVGGEWVRYWNNVNLDPVSEATMDGFVANVKYEF